MNTNFRKVEEGVFLLEKLSDDEERTVKLKPSVYKIWDMGAIRGFRPQFEELTGGDQLVRFKTGIVAEVIEDADKFFKPETRNAYKELKVTHKMGMIFHGKPGTGKTSMCTLIMRELAEKHSAICLDCTGKSLNFIKYVIEELRNIQDNPIVIFVDEFEFSVQREENRYLTFLDGTDSVDNSIFIGCTNYLKKVPKRIKDRKSRIKKLHCISCLPEAVYREYVIDRVPSMGPSEVAEFTHYAIEKEMTIDQLKHALIDHKIEGLPIEKAVESAILVSDVTKEDDED
jgi:hypothetical protein